MRGAPGSGRRQARRRLREAALGQAAPEAVIERGHAVVVEPRRRSCRRPAWSRATLESLAVALQLLADVAQRVLAALAVEFVDRHEIGEIEHVDLLELAGGAEFGRHHIERQIGQRGRSPESPWPMPGVSTITRSKPAALHRSTIGGQSRHLAMRTRAWRASACRLRSARRARSCGCGRPAGRRRLRLGRVDGDDGDLELVGRSRRKRRISSSVRERLARAAGAGDAEITGHGRRTGPSRRLREAPAARCRSRAA